MQEALKKEGVLHGSATVHMEGPELVVDTYRANNASDRDCQVDAIIAAKTAFEKDPDLARLVIRFFDARSSNSYIEMSVTVGDVAAFGAGQISKDQLFASMKIERHEAAPANPPVAAATSPDATTTTGIAAATTSVTTGTPSATATPTPTTEPSNSVVAKAQPKVTASTTTPDSFAGYGLAFSRPSRWQADKPQGTNLLVRYWIPTNNKQQGIAEVRVYSAKTSPAASLFALSPKTIFQPTWKTAWLASIPDEMRGWFSGGRSHHHGGDSHGDYWRSRYHRDHDDNSGNTWHGVDLLKPYALAPKVVIGQSRNITAFQKAFNAQSHMAPSAYLRTVNFSSPLYTYQFVLVVPTSDVSQVNAELDKVLSSVAVAVAGNATPKPQAKHK